MKITMLGTGNAIVTECYNTCFILNDNNQNFLIDTGGGNTLLHQLKTLDISFKDIKHIFITHKHIDHLLGIFWLMRMYLQFMSRGLFNDDVYIYGHDEVINIIKNTTLLLFDEKETCFLGKKIHLITVIDGEEREIIGHKVQFFDIHSTKVKQFGFSIYFNNQKLTCCGDEPFNEFEEKYIQNSHWLLHEAFCLYSQSEHYKPYEKHHSTVKDACMIAQKYNIQNLILYHTEEENLINRKELYIQEGQEYYRGNLFVPDDLESIELD